MRGAHHAHVDDMRFVVSHAANLATFQHAQQLGLHRLGQLADLVKKDRAAVGHFEQADAMLVRAGEGALAMPEQLAFDQALGQGAAVDHDEGHINAQALIVHGPGRQLFAGSGFAAHEHGRVRRGHLRDQVADLVICVELPTSCEPPSRLSNRRLSARYLFVNSRFSATRASNPSSSTSLHGFVK